MDKQESGVRGPLRLVFGILKGVCILVGLPLTVLCLMSVVGLLTGNGWVRAIVAIVVAIGLPVLLVGRLLPDEADQQKQVRGLPTDVLSISWVLIPVLIVGLAHAGVTRSMLAVEGDRLGGGGMETLARGMYWLAGVEAERPEETQLKSKAKAQPKTKTKTKTKANTETKKAPVARAAVKDAGPPTDAGRTDAPPDARKAPEKYTPAELFRTCAPSVVSIKVSSSHGAGGGTGFLIDDKGSVATNSHVIHGASTVEVKLKDGTWVKKVELLEEDEDKDLALLRIKTDKPLRRLKLGDSNTVTVGEQVVSIGNPLGLDYTLTDGLISARRVYRGKKWIQMSAPVSPGNSGGPLFNMKGEVIGVTTRVVAWFRAQNLNLAVPVNVLKKMIKSKYPNRRSVGADSSETW
jgi:S1-C subfamily serine protease